MQAWRTRIILVAVLVALPFEALLLIALWPYLPILGRAATALFVTGCVCLGVRFVAFTWLDIRIKAAHHHREELHSHVIDASGVVVLAQVDGTYAHLSAEHEASKRPLMLAPPPKEEKADPAEDPVNIATVKTMLENGLTLRTIVQSTGLSYYKVQKMCETLRNGN